MNRYIKLGFFFSIGFLIGNGFEILPEVLKGLAVGLSLCCFFLGVYIERKGNISKIKKFKKDLFSRDEK